jgi:putative endonuclease
MQKAPQMKEYWVYILASKRNGTLYIGVTSNLSRRVYEHKEKLIEGFTKKYNITQLVYAEEFQDINDAIHREKCIKKWNRAWKLKLIEEQNPNWEDLYESML